MSTSLREPLCFRAMGHRSSWYLSGEFSHANTISLTSWDHGSPVWDDTQAHMAIDSCYTYTHYLYADGYHFMPIPAAAIRVRVLSDLVGYWSFDEGSGDTAHDYSGKRNDGVIHGGARWTAGLCGTALEFDGVDDYVECGNTLLIDEDFTRICWVKFPDLSVYHEYMISKSQEHSWYSGGWVFTIYGDEIEFGHFGNGMEFLQTASNLMTVDGLWYQVAFTFDVDTDGYHIYFNGEVDTSGTADVNLFTNDIPVYMGAAYNDCGLPDNFSKLILDEVRIYNGALSEAEIKALYSVASVADYSVAGTDIAFEPETPCPVDSVLISAVVHCDPMCVPFDSVNVRFYDGHPDSGGFQIGEDLVALGLTAAAPDTVTTMWVFPDTTCHHIFVEVDPDDAVQEWDEENNRASRVILLTVPATVELVPGILDLTPDPPPVACYIELPWGYKAMRIVGVTLRGCTEEYIEPYPGPWQVGDYDGDNREDLMLLFDYLDALRVVDPRQCGVATIEGLVPGADRCEKYRVRFIGIYEVSAQVVGGFVRGVVSCEENQDPIPGVTVQIFKEALAVGEDITNADGSFSIGYVTPAVYAIVAAKEGYGGASQSGVEFFDGEATVVDLQLSPVGLSGQEEVDIPERYGLSPNCPNPFNPQTTIRYALPEGAQVTLAVYNVAGQRIATLVNQRQEAGYHECVWNGEEVSSGIYFYRISAGNFVETRKMVLLK